MAASSKRELTAKELQFLEELEIELQHEVPKLHTLEKCPYLRSRPRNSTRQFDGHTIKITKYIAKEDEIILNNWKNFCKIYKWDPTFPEPFISMQYSRRQYYIPEPETRTRFVQFIANGLFDRSLHSVFCRFKSLLERTTSFSDFTQKEDKILLRYLKKFEKVERRHYTNAATILGRKVIEVENRYKQLLKLIKSISRKKGKKINWDLKLLTKFMKNLLELTLSNDVMELKNAKIPKVVFEKLQERMKIHQQVLQKKWFNEIHLQLFSPKPIYVNQIKIDLIRLLSECGYTDTRKVPWDLIVQFFDGMSKDYLKNLFDNSTDRIKYKFDISRSDLSIIKYLEKEWIPKLKKDNEKSFKLRLQYRNGKLRIHPDDAKRDLLAKLEVEGSSDAETEFSSEETSESSNFSESEDNSKDEMDEYNFSADDGESVDGSNNFSQLSEGAECNIKSKKTKSNENRIISKENKNINTNDVPIVFDETSKEASVDDGICTGSVETNDNGELWEKESDSSVDPEEETTIRTTLTPALSSDLVKNLLDLTGSDDIKQLKLATIPKIVWKKLEEKLDVSWDELRKIWSLRLHMQLFSPEPVYLNDIKIQLIEMLNEISPTTITDIKWTELAYHFDGATPEFLKSIFDTIMATVNSEVIMTESLDEVLKELHEKQLSKISQSKVDKCLKQLEYVDGTIKIIPLN